MLLDSERHFIVGSPEASVLSTISKGRAAVLSTERFIFNIASASVIMTGSSIGRYEVDDVWKHNGDIVS